MDEKEIRSILAQYTTPLYLFHENDLQQRVSYLRSKLPTDVTLCYAIKANPFLAEYLSPLVDRLELCSPGEYRICQQHNLSPKQFVISGVHKSPELLEEIIPMSSCLLTVESMSQFHLIDQIAQKYQAPVSLLLRLTSGNQFGLEKEEIISILHQLKRHSLLRFCGIQFFSGTQKTSLKRIKRELTMLDDFMEDLASILGHSVSELEYGPGFPVDYYAENAFPEDEFLDEFSQMLQALRFSGAIILELGRSLVAYSGTYLTRVVDVKCNHQQNYAIVDGGIHQLVYYGQSMAMRVPPVKHISSHAPGKLEPWNICGSLCTINDILVKQLPLPHVHIGDILVFSRTGAYCMSEGISLFLSRDLPSVLYCHSNGILEELRPHMDTYPLNTKNNKK